MLKSRSHLGRVTPALAMTEEIRGVDKIKNELTL
jgi:hypothetical protein